MLSTLCEGNSLPRDRFQTQTNSNSKLPQYIMAEKAVGLCIFITTPLLDNNNRKRWVCHMLGLVSGQCSHIVDKVVTPLWQNDETFSCFLSSLCHNM